MVGNHGKFTANLNSAFYSKFYHLDWPTTDVIGSGENMALIAKNNVMVPLPLSRDHRTGIANANACLK
jgi:hypothetical protein